MDLVNRDNSLGRLQDLGLVNKPKPKAKKKKEKTVFQKIPASGDDIALLAWLVYHLGFQDNVPNPETGQLVFETPADVGENLRSLFTMLRTRDNQQQRPLWQLLGQWKLVETSLLPLIIAHKGNYEVLLAAVKLLVQFTLPIPKGTVLAKMSEGDRYLTEAKAAFVNNPDATAVLLGLIADPLANVVRDKDSVGEADTKLLELILTLYRNLLQAPNPPRRIEDAGIDLQSSFIKALHRVGIIESLLFITQGIQDVEFRSHNFLILEIWYLIFGGRSSDAVISPGGFPAVVSSSSSSFNQPGHSNSASNALKQVLDSESASLASVSSATSSRHSRFGGAWTMTAGLVKPIRRVSSNPLTRLNVLPEPAKKQVRRNPRKKVILEADQSTDPVRLDPELAMILAETAVAFIKDGCFNALSVTLKDDLTNDAMSTKIIESDQYAAAWCTSFFLGVIRLMNEPGLDGAESPLPSLPSLTQDLSLASVLLDAGAIRALYRSLRMVHDKKDWHTLGALIEAFTETMLALGIMFHAVEAERPDGEDSEPPQSAFDIAEHAQTLLAHVFYEMENIQLLGKIVREYQPHLAPPRVGDSVLILVHTLVTLCGEYSDAGEALMVEKRRRKTKSKKQKQDANMAEADAVGAAMLEGTDVTAADADSDAEPGKDDPYNEEYGDVISYDVEMTATRLRTTFCSAGLMDTLARGIGRVVDAPLELVNAVIGNIKGIDSEPGLRAFLWYVPILDAMNNLLNSPHESRIRGLLRLRAAVVDALTGFFTALQGNPLLMVEAVFAPSTRSVNAISDKMLYDERGGEMIGVRAGASGPGGARWTPAELETLKASFPTFSEDADRDYAISAVIGTKTPAEVWARLKKEKMIDGAKSTRRPWYPQEDEALVAAWEKLILLEEPELTKTRTGAYTGEKEVILGLMTKLAKEADYRTPGEVKARLKDKKILSSSAGAKKAQGWTEDDDELLMNFWKAFAGDKGEVARDDPELVVSKIAAEMEGRTLGSVRNRLRQKKLLADPTKAGQWTLDDDDLLKATWIAKMGEEPVDEGKMDNAEFWDDLYELFRPEFTIKQIKLRVRHWGLLIGEERQEGIWTDADDTALRMAFEDFEKDKKRASLIAERLGGGRTPSQVQARLRHLNLVANPRRSWTQEEDDELATLWATARHTESPAKSIAEVLTSRPEAVIAKRLVSLKLVASMAAARGGANRKRPTKSARRSGGVKAEQVSASEESGDDDGLDDSDTDHETVPSLVRRRKQRRSQASQRSQRSQRDDAPVAEKAEEIPLKEALNKVEARFKKASERGRVFAWIREVAEAALARKNDPEDDSIGYAIVTETHAQEKWMLVGPVLSSFRALSGLDMDAEWVIPFFDDDVVDILTEGIEELKTREAAIEALGLPSDDGSDEDSADALTDDAPSQPRSAPKATRRRKQKKASVSFAPTEEGPDPDDEPSSPPQVVGRKRLLVRGARSRLDEAALALVSSDMPILDDDIELPKKRHRNTIMDSDTD